MAEHDLTELKTDAPREDGEELDEDNLLKPSFVNSVIDALESGDHGRAYVLVSPHPPAHIAHLF
jgi:magnesium transporter